MSLTDKYEKIIHAIANIDTFFHEFDGNDRDFNDSEALEKIMEMVQPIWSEYCEKER